MYVSVTGSSWSPRLTLLATVLTGRVRIANCVNITHRHKRFHRPYVTAHSVRSPRNFVFQAVAIGTEGLKGLAPFKSDDLQLAGDYSERLAERLARLRNTG